MKTNVHSKMTAFWLVIPAVFLIALFALSLQANRAGYKNLMMAVPNAFGVPKLNPEKLEEFAEEHFLLTYEIRSPATAEAVHSKHSAVLIGTNHNYAGVMGYGMLDGGFFTKAAMDSKSRHVVLNETAAFQIFGSNRITGSTLKINGETWLVAGVVQDNDAENANLYAPSAVTGGQAGSVMVLLDEAVTEAYAKNALKSAGIRDNGYDFINLAKTANAFGERFAVAWKAAAVSLILLFILAAGKKLLQAISLYRAKMRAMYVREMIIRYRIDLLKSLCVTAAFTAGIAAALLLSRQILKTCLTWQELTAITGELAAGDFGHKLLWLRDYQIFGEVLFWLCIGMVAIGFLVVLLRRRGPASRRPQPRYRLKAGHIGNYRIS